MVVLDKFYQVVEREALRVSSLWKFSHVLACVVAAVCGFLTSLSFGRVLSDFNYNCVLNADIVFDNETYLNSSTPVRAIDLTLTSWGSSSACSFAHFTSVVAMISALIWGVYFAMMSRGGAGSPTDSLSRPWTILYPCICFTSIFFVVYVISTQQLKNGLKEFCLTFQPELNNTGCVPQMEVYTTQFREPDGNPLFFLHPNMVIAIITPQIGIWAWVFQLVLCILRVFSAADFDLQLVTVVTKGEEEVENVFELENESEQISNL